jgi:hypothetical protein
MEGKEMTMKRTQLAMLTLGLGFAACAHAPKPYSFTAEQATNDVDVVVRTLVANGMKVTEVDRKAGKITTQWFDTGYKFRDSNDYSDDSYQTDIFLRYQVRIEPAGGKENIVLNTDVQRCAPADSVVTSTGVQGTCLPMSVVFPTQQKQAEELGERLRVALAGATDQPGRM